MCYCWCSMSEVFDILSFYFGYFWAFVVWVFRYPLFGGNIQIVVWIDICYVVFWTSLQWYFLWNVVCAFATLFLVVFWSCTMWYNEKNLKSFIWFFLIGRFQLKNVGIVIWYLILFGISFLMRLVVTISIHGFVFWEDGRDRIVVVGISFLMWLVVTHLNP